MDKKEKTQKKTRYIEEHYRRYTYRVRNDNTKVIERLQLVGRRAMNSYITRLIEEDIERNQ